LGFIKFISKRFKLKCPLFIKKFLRKINSNNKNLVVQNLDPNLETNLNLKLETTKKRNTFNLFKVSFINYIIKALLKNI
jgi:hypothetical protein